MDCKLLDTIGDAIAWRICAGDPLLDAEEARFLRKHLLFTQDELAAKMGISRVTIADWERGAAVISPQHDFILRALVLARLATSAPPQVRKQPLWSALTATRSAPPRRRRLVIERSLLPV